MPAPRVLVFSLLIISGLILPIEILSQYKTDPEAEYARIRDIAFNGDYALAETEARKLVNAFPDYGDARILLGRVMAWQKKYDEALSVIDTLLAREPENSDALSAKKDIKLWNKENSPVSTELKAGYFFDTFSLPYKRFWQVFNAGAGHKFGWGKGSAGINIGNLHAGDSPKITDTEFQLEAEAWPEFSSRNYGYLAYAYSPGDHFPRHRAAAELWQVLPAGWAVSAGLNYYYFNRNIFIATASVEKYLGKYWLSARGFLYFKDEGPTASLYLTARRYLGNIDYLQITAGMGTAPDEPFDLQTDLMRYSAYSIRLTLNKSVAPRIVIRAGAGYSREEYAENEWRNRFEGGVSLTYALKMK